jgi:cytochrome c5
MAEYETEHQEGPIKSPRQLAVVVALAFAVPIILASLLASLASRSIRPDEGSLSSEAVADRIQPVARLNVGDAASEAKGTRSPEQVVQTTCAACHQTGAAGAPKISDRAAWAPRIAKGLKGLLQSAIKGVGAMPPRGGNPDLTDTELESAIALMANQSGASFKPAGSK